MPEAIRAFSWRVHRNMSLSYGDTRNSLKSRKNFLESLRIDYRHLVCAKQTHGSNVRYVGHQEIGSGALDYESAIADTDAFITDKPGVPLAVLTADCLSVFLYDPKKPAIGLVHAGWRSSRQEITAKTIEAMIREFKTNPEDLYVDFGPSIRSCCYEVEKKFEEYFSFGLKQKDDLYYLDLVEVNKKQALLKGVKEERILDLGLCTSCRGNDFYSFRKEGKDCGRLMSVMMLK